MDGYLRIGFGEEIEYLREGLNRLHDVISNLGLRTSDYGAPASPNVI